MEERKKILIIEDNIDWLLYLKACLEEQEYIVITENNLNSALIRVNSEKFDFITTNMQLNELTFDADKLEGWQILNAVGNLNNGSLPPILVITGFTEDYIKLKSKKIHSDVLLMDKGRFNRKDFISVISNQINT